jgi:inositol-pentakisphosphate 2-kinase
VAFLPKEIYIGKPMNGEFKDSPTICIEIKVKQGYMMDEDSSTLGYEIKKCRYCYFQVWHQSISRKFIELIYILFFSHVFQYLKLKTAKISNISLYCPIDLFSGKADRMNRAIKGLFENPQNNLKMFQDGKMVYNEYSSDKGSLKRIMKSLFPDVKSVDK